MVFRQNKTVTIHGHQRSRAYPKVELVEWTQVHPFGGTGGAIKSRDLWWETFVVCVQKWKTDSA